MVGDFLGAFLTLRAGRPGNTFLRLYGDFGARLCGDSPCPSFPWFFGFPWLILSKGFPWLICCFLLLPRVLEGSEGRTILGYLGGFRWQSRKTKEKRRTGTGPVYGDCNRNPEGPVRHLVAAG